MIDLGELVRARMPEVFGGFRYLYTEQRDEIDLLLARSLTNTVHRLCLSNSTEHVVDVLDLLRARIAFNDVSPEYFEAVWQKRLDRLGDYATTYVTPVDGRRLADLGRAAAEYERTEDEHARVGRG